MIRLGQGLSLTHPVYSAHTHCHSRTHTGLTCVTRSPSENWVLSQDCVFFFLTRLFFVFDVICVTYFNITSFCGVFSLCLCVPFLLVHHISLLLHTLLDMFNTFFPFPSLPNSLPPTSLCFSLTSLISPSSFFKHCTCPVAFYLNTLSFCVCLCVCVCSAILQCGLTVTQATIRYHSQNASCRKQKVHVFVRVCMCVHVCR